MNTVNNLQFPENVRWYEYMNYEQFKQLDKEKTVFFLPISPLEVHGYHLPLNTDQLSAIRMAELTGIKFANAHQDHTVIIMPVIGIGTGTLPLPGSIEHDRETVYKVIYNTGKTLAGYGFKNIIVLNGHGALHQNLALDDACRKICKRYKIQMFSPGIILMEKFVLGHRFTEIEKELGRPLSDEEKKGLSMFEHGAGWETSIVMAINEKWVDKRFKDFRPYEATLSGKDEKIISIAGKALFFIPWLKNVLKDHKSGTRQLYQALKTSSAIYSQKVEVTYLGAPHVASLEIGRAWEEVFARELNILIHDVIIEKKQSARNIYTVFSHLFFLRREFFVISFWAIFLISALLLIWLHFK
jgi:creatinine amidohydrolase/Fe(II)-dependent formamide hydrolase-like protein